MCAVGGGGGEGRGGGREGGFWLTCSCCFSERGKGVRFDGKEGGKRGISGAFIYTKQLGMRHYGLRSMRYEVLYEI